jgi:hypothetical protein
MEDCRSPSIPLRDAAVNLFRIGKARGWFTGWFDSQPIPETYEELEKKFPEKFTELNVIAHSIIQAPYLEALKILGTPIESFLGKGETG